jgi:hypothetical protein
MSQIASAYVVSKEQIAELNTFASDEDWDSYWNLLHEEATEVEPDFGYSGYVVVVLITFLEESGVQLPSVEKYGTGFKETSIVSCMSPEEAVTFAKVLQDFEIEVEDDKLHEYYIKFTEEEFDEAGEAMREALEFLTRACKAAAKERKYVLINVG